MIQPGKTVLGDESEYVVYDDKFASDADQWYADLLGSLSWEERYITIYGRQIRMPRLMAWYSPVAYRFSGATSLLPKSIATHKTIKCIKQRVDKQLGTNFNSVLVNYYKDGKESVAWHADNERELDPEVIASVSLGAVRRFDIQEERPFDIQDQHRSDMQKLCQFDIQQLRQFDAQDQHPFDIQEQEPQKLRQFDIQKLHRFDIQQQQLRTWSVYLTPGSLLVMYGLQRRFKHRIPKEVRVKDGRINLTFRNMIPG